MVETTMAWALLNPESMLSRACWFLIWLPVFLTGCNLDYSANDPVTGQSFVVQVANEQFVMRITHSDSIRFAMENLQGKNSMHPSGRIAIGNAGFNQPWNWHFIPESVRMVEASIEVCDAIPSYVDNHLNDFLAVGYCPWSAKIIRVGS